MRLSLLKTIIVTGIITIGVLGGLLTWIIVGTCANDMCIFDSFNTVEVLGK